MFEDGQTNVHVQKPSGQPSILSDGHVQSVDQKICERRRLTISEPDVNFHKFHALVSSRLSQLGYAVTSFAQDAFRKCSRVTTKLRESLRR
jgi:hypothetical protein